MKEKKKKKKKYLPTKLGEHHGFLPPPHPPAAALLSGCTEVNVQYYVVIVPAENRFWSVFVYFDYVAGCTVV